MAPIAFESTERLPRHVRGARPRRAARGALRNPLSTVAVSVFAYEGLDHVSRTGVVAFSEPPWRMTAGRADFMFALAPGGRADLFIEAGPEEEDAPPRPGSHRRAGAHDGVRQLRQTRGAA